MINLSGLDAEETLLVARIEDAARIAGRGKSSFTAFFNERQQMIAGETIRQRRLTGCMLWGGYPQAERKMLGAFPDWTQPALEDFPLAAMTVWLPKGAQPSHRDVLGSLMAMRIGRECIGDILIADRRCDEFVQGHLTRLLAGELTKIGGFGVRCEFGAPGEYARREDFKQVRGTVSSPRMDALTAVLTGFSREKSAELIRAEQVQSNYRIVRSISAPFAPGDVITIRGSGKFTVDEIGAPTKKGRLPVVCRKYL